MAGMALVQVLAIPEEIWVEEMRENQKNGKSWTNWVEKNRNRDLINDSCTVFYGEFSYDSGFRPNPV